MADQRSAAWSPTGIAAISAVVGFMITLGIAVLASFYSLIDPRADIKVLRDDLHANYLTIREHAEFQTRVARDIARIEEENTRQNANAVSHAEVNEVWRQRRAEIDEIQHRLDALAARMQEHERDDRILNGAGQKGGNK